jgi:hypothetical protein
VSFDIFFQCFKNGDSGEFPVGLFERAFHAFAEQWDVDHVFLRFPDGGIGEIYARTGGETLQGFMISHAPANPEFWEALFELLRDTPSCIFWAGGGPGGPLLVNPDARNHLPISLVEDTEPIVATSPQQIVEAIFDDYVRWQGYRDWIKNRTP